MKTTATNKRLRELLTGISNGSLIPRPDFQRRLVWINKHKLEFIKTVLSGYPFPEIYIAAGDINPDTGEGTLLLVDGQQRITTLYQYFKGSSELKLGKEITPYNELSSDEKINFLEYEVVARDLGKMPIEEIKTIFKKINSTSYSLNAMEVHNARYDGDFKNLGEEIAESDFFEKHKIFTATDVRRMNDVTFCLSLAITIMSTYFNRDDEIESYLEKYNEDFESKSLIKSEMLETLKFIESCGFGESSRIWKKVDFYSVFVELHRILIKEKKSLDKDKTSKVLEQFFISVDQVNEKSPSYVKDYSSVTLQATNDRKSRIARGEVLKKIFEQVG